MKPGSRFSMSVVALLAASSLLGHGGGLNKDGCHNDRSNGTYHCHGGGSSSRSSPSSSAPKPLALSQPQRLSSTQMQASSSAATVEVAQNLLVALGYDISTVDGTNGPQTQQALRHFQADRRIFQSGTVNDQTLIELSRVVRDRLSR